MCCSEADVLSVTCISPGHVVGELARVAQERALHRAHRVHRSVRALLACAGPQARQEDGVSGRKACEVEGGCTRTSDALTLTRSTVSLDEEEVLPTPVYREVSRWRREIGTGRIHQTLYFESMATASPKDPSLLRSRLLQLAARRKLLEFVAEALHWEADDVVVAPVELAHEAPGAA